MAPALQPIEPLAEQPRDDDQPVQRLSDRYPVRLVACHLMAIFGIRTSRFYQLEAAGRFKRFELRPTIGRKAWSRETVQRSFDRTGEFAPRAD